MTIRKVSLDEIWVGQREYFSSWEAALSSWGKLNDRPIAVAEVKEVIHRLSEVNGAVTKAFIPEQTRPYVAVLFENDSNRAGAWIHVGYVDHLVPVANSEKYENKDVFYSKLSTWSEKAGGVKTEQAQFILCPNCHGMQVPLTGSCGCGWDPRS